MASTSNAIGWSRFWVSACVPQYTQHVLPTRIPFPASHSICANAFSTDTVHKSAWSHTVLKPPRSASQASPSLVRSFAEPTAERASAPRKRAKLSLPVPQQQLSTPEEPDEPKRKNVPFQRQQALNGKLRSYKIRMYPDAEQRVHLRRWYSAANRAYNSALCIVQGMRTKANFISIRNQLTSAAVTPPELKWTLSVPTKVRARAVKQLVDAHNINIQERGAGQFRLQFRSYKKDPVGTVILEKAFGRNTGPLHHFSASDLPTNSRQKKYAEMHLSPKHFTGCAPGILIRDRVWLIDKLVSDGKLLEDGKIMWDKHTNQYYLIVLIDTPVVKTPIDPNTARVVSLDPGVRPFNTFYSPDGTHGKLWVGAADKIDGMNKRIDWLTSKRDKEKNKYEQSVQAGSPDRVKHAKHRRRSSRLQARIRLLSAKLRNWRTNAHYDAVNFLLDRFDVLIVPRFETSKMVKKDSRNIGPKTVRSMYALAHYSFRQKLLSKAEMDTSKLVRIVREPGTTGTCGACGNWNANVKDKKIFVCGCCGVELDRDVNGARNNMLATLVA